METCLSSETVVFLIRQVRGDDLDLFGRLVGALSGRTARIAKCWAQGFDKGTTEEIVLQVEIKIIELLLAKTPSRQSDFLEVAFGKAVERQTINAVAKRKRSPLALLKHAPACDDAAQSERPTEEIEDERPSPEEIFAELEAKIQRPELIKKASAAVTDHRHLEAVILRHVRGWPITDKDTTKPSLARHFGKSEKQIRNWIKDALEAMRAAIGDKK
jgi:DNA-directed RNA polymerase sigma subunit (sigma70/sigma32)